MKKYIILFFILLSSCVYAPNLSNSILEATKVIIEVEKIKNLELDRDAKDTIFLNKFNMLKYFSYEDRKKARNYATSLRIDPKWLYQIFFIECRGNANCRPNPFTGASGLIGFLPSTAELLGTDIHSIRKMNTNEQLDYVYKYLKLAANGRQLKSLLDTYLAVFSPNSINKKESHVIGNHDQNAYKFNKALDINKDSLLTVKDIKVYINRIFI